MIMSTKVSIRQKMKSILIISALLHWDWLANKCFKIETVTSETVQL